MESGKPREGTLVFTKEWLNFRDHELLHLQVAHEPKAYSLASRGPEIMNITFEGVRCRQERR